MFGGVELGDLDVRASPSFSRLLESSNTRGQLLVVLVTFPTWIQRRDQNFPRRRRAVTPSIGEIRTKTSVIK